MSEKTSCRRSSKAALMLGTSLVSSIGAAASSSASATGPSFGKYPSLDLRNNLKSLANNFTRPANVTPATETAANLETSSYSEYLLDYFRGTSRASDAPSASIWSWIKDSASSFRGKLKDAANSIDNATGNYASWASSKIKEKTGDLWEGAKESTKKLYNSADNYFEGRISTNANKLWEKTKDFGGTVAEKADKLEGVLAKGTNAISEGAKKAFNYVDGKWGNKISSFAKENVEKLKNSEFAKDVSDWGNKIAESDMYKKVAPYTVDVVKRYGRTIGLVCGVTYLVYKFYKSYTNKNEEKKEENKDSNVKRRKTNKSSSRYIPKGGSRRRKNG